MAPDAPLDPNSAVYVGDLLSQIASDRTWINTYAYSTPVFMVPSNQPTVPATLDAGFSTAMQALQQTWTAVPIPPTPKRLRQRHPHGHLAGMAWDVPIDVKCVCE